MDTLTRERRSENMRRIRSKNTSPEVQVRTLLRASGFSGYRLHRRDLPGKPDIAFIGRRLLIDVRGCFWHKHSCSEGKRTPKSNIQYWLDKIAGNINRDRKNVRMARINGWSTLVIWECELKRPEKVRKRLCKFLSGK